MTPALTLLAQTPADGPRDERARAVHVALLDLRDRTNTMLADICLLAAEAHERGYWRILQNAAGWPYASEEDYFREVLDVGTYRSAAKRISVGRALLALPDGERAASCAAVASIGLSKAAVLAPVLEATDREMRDRWFARAETVGVEALQQEVSAALGARPRGMVGGDRVRGWLLNCMPDMDSRLLCERVLELGARETGSTNAVAILIAAFQEALAAWEPGQPL